MTTFIRVSNDTLIPLKSVQSIRFVQSITLEELCVSQELEVSRLEQLSPSEIVSRYVPSSKAFKHLDEEIQKACITMKVKGNGYSYHETLETDYHGVFVIETNSQEYVLTYADVQFFELRSLILKPLGLM